jgi:hypothetical protein
VENSASEFSTRWIHIACIRKGTRLVFIIQEIHLNASNLVECGNTLPFHTLQLLLLSSFLQYFVMNISVVKNSDFGTYAARGCGALSQYFYEHFNYFLSIRNFQKI